jgi:hypothetical protein
VVQVLEDVPVCSKKILAAGCGRRDEVCVRGGGVMNAEGGYMVEGGGLWLSQAVAGVCTYPAN